uniref:Kinesin-like protein KIF1B n=1 Tax=Anthurium amnicola TaxID=1678845 RepID=A0A1D1XVA9_9ARAE
MVFFALNSYDQETTSNTFHFRDSSTDSSDSSLSTTPSSTPTSPVSQNNNMTLNNNTPNLQRRASESVTDSIQFKKLPARRYTLPSKFGLPLSKFWEAGRDSSVQVAMDNVQFGL